MRSGEVKKESTEFAESKIAKERYKTFLAELYAIDPQFELTEKIRTGIKKFVAAEERFIEMSAQLEQSDPERQQLNAAYRNAWESGDKELERKISDNLHRYNQQPQFHEYRKLRDKFDRRLGEFLAIKGSIQQQALEKSAIRKRLTILRADIDAEAKKNTTLAAYHQNSYEQAQGESKLCNMTFLRNETARLLSSIESHDQTIAILHTKNNLLRLSNKVESEYTAAVRQRDQAKKRLLQGIAEPGELESAQAALNVLLHKDFWMEWYHAFQATPLLWLDYEKASANQVVPWDIIRPYQAEKVSTRDRIAELRSVRNSTRVRLSEMTETFFNDMSKLLYRYENCQNHSSLIEAGSAESGVSPTRPKVLK